MGRCCRRRRASQAASSVADATPATNTSGCGGKTHYSSSKAEADGAAITHLRGAPGPAGGSSQPYTPSLNEEIIRRGTQGTPTIDGHYVPPPPKPVVRNYGSEAPADKCQLARDILSGFARRTNGKSTDARDRANLGKREPERLASMRQQWEAWNETMPAIPADASVKLGYGIEDMPQR